MWHEGGRESDPTPMDEEQQCPHSTMCCALMAVSDKTAPIASFFANWFAIQEDMGGRAKDVQ